MVASGLIRIGMILASVAPSMLCFGLSAYLLAHKVADGWGWLMLIGLMGLDVPKKLLKLPEECPTCRARHGHEKPEPAYYEEVA